MGKNITEILNTIITKGYDKRVRPNYAGESELVCVFAL